MDEYYLPDGFLSKKKREQADTLWGIDLFPDPNRTRFSFSSRFL
jgi:hypothetical protein